MPGGLLVVEAVLVPGLVSSGMTLASAISAMLIYRLISWIFIAAIGWVVFFFMFRTEKDVDPDAAVDEDVEQPPQFSPDPEAPSTNPNPNERAACMRGRHLPHALGGSRADQLRAHRRPKPPSAPDALRPPRPLSQTPGPTVATPVLASVVAAPVPVPATDGKIHLAYELQLTNVLDQE